MNKIQRAVHEIHSEDARNIPKTEKADIHPLSRFFVTIFYLLLVVSFPKYDITGLFGMVLYLLIMGIWYEISWKECFRKLWGVLILVALVGIANPVLDREIATRIYGLPISFGMLSMLSLLLKGVFCLLASYCMLWITGFHNICYALRCIHVPKELVTMLFLMERYLVVFLKESERMLQAYQLRAPGQRGIHFKAWGAFLGQLLLRTVDRAEGIYDSMQLRGYSGELVGKKISFRWSSSIFYVVAWGLVLLVFRFYPIYEVVGRMLF